MDCKLSETVCTVRTPARLLSNDFLTRVGARDTNV